MKAGIIAAGLGERFRDAGIVTPKPLLDVAGKTLLDRVVEAVVEGGAEEIALIVNAESPEVASYVGQRRWPVPVTLTVKTTPSSMESLFTLAPQLAASVPSCSPRRRRVRAGRAARVPPAAARHADAAVVLAVTDFVDDEKPLRRRARRRRPRFGALGAAAAASRWSPPASTSFIRASSPRSTRAAAAA